MISFSDVEKTLKNRFDSVFNEKDIDVKVSTGINAPSEAILINAKIGERSNYDNHNLEYVIEVYIDFKSAYAESKKERLQNIEQVITDECLLDCWIFTRFHGLLNTELTINDPQPQPELKKYYSNKVLILRFRGK